MKLRELIDNVDRSKKNNSYVALDELGTELGLELDYIKEDDHQVRAYWLTSWCCTDTWVGLRVYGFERDESYTPFAVSKQDARKCDEIFHWLSQEEAIRVREYLISLMEKDTPSSVNVLESLDEDMGDGFKVTYSGQLLARRVIEDATGEAVEVIQTFHSMKDIRRWGYVVIQRSNGEQAEVSMEDITVPYCLRQDAA